MTDADDQPLPASPSQRVPQRGQTRRRDPLTVDAIVDAALRLLDAQGLDGLSMRGLAQDLDTGAATLYWHVGSKDGLLDLVFDRIIGEQEAPDADPERWQEQVREVAHIMRATILRHRDVVRLSIGRIPTGPHALTYSDRVLAIMRAGGLPDRLAVTGHLLLISAVNGFTLDETGQPETDGAIEPAPGGATRDYLAALPASRFPHLVALADQFAVADNGARFDLLLDIFVEGLSAARRLPRI